MAFASDSICAEASPEAVVCSSGGLTHRWEPRATHQSRCEWMWKRLNMAVLVVSPEAPKLTFIAHSSPLVLNFGFTRGSFIKH